MSTNHGIRLLFPPSDSLAACLQGDRVGVCVTQLDPQLLERGIVVCGCGRVCIDRERRGRNRGVERDGEREEGFSRGRMNGVVRLHRIPLSLPWEYTDRSRAWRNMTCKASSTHLKIPFLPPPSVPLMTLCNTNCIPVPVPVPRQCSPGSVPVLRAAVCAVKRVPFFASPILSKAKFHGEREEGGGKREEGGGRWGREQRGGE